MAESADVDRSRRYRITLPALFMSITAVCACLANLRLQILLPSSPRFSRIIHDIVEIVSVHPSLMLAIVQFAGLGFAVAALVIWGQPKWLWAYVAAQVPWVAIRFLGTIWPGFWSPTWMREPIMFWYFLEPACAVVFAGLAFYRSLFIKHRGLSIATAAIFVLGFVAQLYAIEEIIQFAAAMGALVNAAAGH